MLMHAPSGHTFFSLHDFDTTPLLLKLVNCLSLSSLNDNWFKAAVVICTAVVAQVEWLIMMSRCPQSKTTRAKEIKSEMHFWTEEWLFVTGSHLLVSRMY